MNTLIVYATKYGCTQKCAEMLSKKISGKVELCNLRTNKVPDLSKYEKIVIGGPVYIGRIRKEVSNFCSKNLNTLKGKKVGLFICNMRDGDIAKEELNSSFPDELLNNAVAKDCFGGEFRISKMNALDRLIVKKVSNVEEDMSNISEENIYRFAQLINDI